MDYGRALYDVQRAPHLREAMIAEYRAGHIKQDTEWPLFSGGRHGPGKLLKARFPQDAVNNCYWFWIPVGNCAVCEHYIPQSPDGKEPPECEEGRIDDSEFRYYQENALCPYWELGAPEYEEGGFLWHRNQAMKAAGMLGGDPVVEVVILQGPLDWTPWRSFQADCQQRFFIAMSNAMAEWRRMYGDKPDPSTQEGLDPNRDWGDIDEGPSPV